MQAATDVGPTSGAIFVLQNVVPDKSAANTKVFEERLAAHFAACDRQLGEQEYLAGALSIADFYLYPTYVARAELVKAAGQKNLPRWAALMAKRPGVDRGMKVPG
jgi:GST-like protein